MLAHGAHTRHFCIMMFNYSKNKSKFILRKKGALSDVDGGGAWSCAM